MHETLIAKRILEEAKKAGAKKALEVEVGELGEVTPEEVEETLRNMTRWRVKVSFKRSRVSCKCGYQGPAHIVEKGHGYCVFDCPRCGKKPDVLEGGEIKVIGIS
ncbi:hydrogenase maturation nickel metallochaperone HypA [Candidatus Woesearchaeota archaeon]|nr:hydrogenase maturation nickel metallochaperone HypA [Candidatus Woesearchaeota archaeon]